MLSHFNLIAASCASSLVDVSKGTTCSQSFFATGIGAVLAYVMAVVGILAIVYAVFKGITDYLGNSKDASIVSIVVRILITAVLGALLITPSLIDKFISTGGTVADKVTSTVDTAASTNGTNISR